jgi:hypothetical protein
MEDPRATPSFPLSKRSISSAPPIARKVPGHRRLDSTAVYARVHDRTVAEDYYAAMDRVEQRLQIAPPADVHYA